MRNAINKDFFREIKYTLNRYCLLYTSDQAMQRQQSYKTQEGRAMLKLQEGSTHHGGCGNCGGDR